MHKVEGEIEAGETSWSTGRRASLERRRAMNGNSPVAVLDALLKADHLE
jgi:hypothetical protein